MEPDVLVLGGGIAGACVGLALRERGASAAIVTPVDGHPGRATGASAGMLTPQYEEAGPEALLRLAIDGRNRYPAFAERVAALSGIDVGLRQEGMLVACRTSGEERDASGLADRHVGAGLRASLLDAPAAMRLQPGLSDAIRAFLWLPGEGHIDSQALARALPVAVRAAGVEWIAGAAARIQTGGRGVEGVQLAGGGWLPARQVVVACGAWSASLEGLPRTLPVRPVRGQIVRLRASRSRTQGSAEATGGTPGSAGPSAAAEGARIPSVLLADMHGHYLAPRADGTCLAGSTMEEDGFESHTDEATMRMLESEATSLFPALDGAERLEAWAGLRPFAPDGLPILGPDPDVEGLFYATGYGRNGILLGPVAGDLLADIITKRDPAQDWRPFGIGRWGSK